MNAREGNMEIVTHKKINIDRDAAITVHFYR